MKTLKYAIVITSLVALSPQAKAEDTAAQLVQRCVTDNNVAKAACYNYLWGVWDGMMEESAHMCPPDNRSVSVGMMYNQFLYYVKENQGEFNDEAGDVVHRAYYQKWGCPE